MDTLRLLSRSSGLKFNRNNSNQFQDSTRLLPSSAGSNDQNGEALNEGQSSRKRKREDSQPDPGASQELTEAEIRQIQKQHKIKITNLRALRAGKREVNRKVQKEASRLFSQPLQKFAHLKQSGVNGALISNIAEQAFKDPTEIQLATIPLLLSADDEEPDLLSIAPTGSGKTLAFLIPLIDKICRAHRCVESDDRHVSAIILAPTKELVGQIVNEGRKLMINTGVRISALTKGVRLHADQEIRSSNASEDESDDDDDDDNDRISQSTVVKSDIVVATPLTLVHTLTPKGSDAPQPLERITHLILDEADVLLDVLFREQTLSVWSACSSPQLRVSLWSATIGASIEDLAITTIDEQHERHQIKPRRIPLIRTIIGLKDASLPHINHRLTYASTEPGKLMGLRQLLRPAPSGNKTSTSKDKQTRSETETPLRPPFLIFTQTISRAQSLYDELQYDIPASAGGSSRIALLHSSLSSKQRSDTMTSFRQGKIWILITTDLLSRGVDFRGVNGVVNYDIPTTAASYVHRAGRTGRAGRKGGIVVTFYTRDDVKYLKPIANIISASEKAGLTTNTTNTTDTSSNIIEPKPFAITTDTIPTSTTRTTNTKTKTTEGNLPSWLIPSLPHLTKSRRQDLKHRGAQERRAIKKSDDDRERRSKLQNRIGTKSGYDRQREDRRRGMVEGSKRRNHRYRLQEEGEGRNGGGGEDGDGAEFEGFRD